MSHAFHRTRRAASHRPGSDRALPPLRGDAAAGVTVQVRVAAAWSWRLIIVLTAVGLFGYVVSTITVVVIPVLIAGLLVALLPVAGQVLVPRSSWQAHSGPGHLWPRRGLALAFQGR